MDILIALLAAALVLVGLPGATFFVVRGILRRFSSLQKRHASIVSGIVGVFVLLLFLFYGYFIVSFKGHAVGNSGSSIVGKNGSSIVGDKGSTVRLPEAPPNPAPTPQDRLPRSAVATVLTVNAEPRATDGVWGLILLGKTRPDNAMVCDHFYSAFPLAQHPMDEHRFILRPTYWPDRRRASELPKQTNCGDLVTNYDWIWTNAILNQLGRDGVAGPVLVGYGPAPNAPGMLTRTILDLSDWPTSELALGFAKWTQTITSYPSDWRGVTFAETLRLGLRNFLIVHGDSLFAAVINPGELVQRAYADSPRDGQHQSPQLVEIDLSQ